AVALGVSRTERPYGPTRWITRLRCCARCIKNRTSLRPHPFDNTFPPLRSVYQEQNVSTGPIRSKTLLRVALGVSRTERLNGAHPFNDTFALLRSVYQGQNVPTAPPVR